MTFGVTPEGFRRKSVLDLLAELEADQKADLGPDFDNATETVPGQLNGTFANQLGIVWEQVEILYHANDPEAAEGRLLEQSCKLTGTFKVGDTPSEVWLTCNLDDETELVAGEAFAAITDKPDILWTPKETFTADSTGDHSVLFVSVLTGPIPGFAGTIAVINTAIVGWNSVVNPDDAELGLSVDLDPALRLRREREIATIGSATVRAITANVSQAFVGKITSLTVFENEGDNIDENGLLPHSVETLIFDGDVPTVDNDELAQVIFDSKAGGIQALGNTFGTANALVNGVETTKQVGFTRAEQLPIYLIINLVKKPGAAYVGDQAVKEYVATAANAYFGPGDEVVEDRIRAFTLANAGVKDINGATGVKLGLATDPTGTVNIAVGLRQQARFSTSRITIVST